MKSGVAITAVRHALANLQMRSGCRCGILAGEQQPWTAVTCHRFAGRRLVGVAIWSWGEATRRFVEAATSRSSPRWDRKTARLPPYTLQRLRGHNPRALHHGIDHA